MREHIVKQTEYRLCVAALQSSTQPTPMRLCVQANRTLALYAFCIAVLVHDIRRPDQILHRLSGHVAPNLNKTKAIYHPHFVDKGCSVLVTGQGLRKLSLYDVSSGATISRGALGYDATALASDVSGELLAAAGGKSDGIALLAPIRERGPRAVESASASAAGDAAK